MMAFMHGDCLEKLGEVDAGSVNLIASDLPYGTTRCAWDSVIPLDALWEAYRRVLAPDGCVVLTAAMPFTAALAASNLGWLRYDLVWVKNRATGHLNAKRAPLRGHESVLVFAPGATVYNPQKTVGHKPVNPFYSRSSGACFGEASVVVSGGGQTDRYPTSVLRFPSVSNVGSERLHPNQKPVELFEWIVATYSNPGDLVLDSCFGSCTTGIAAYNLGRRFIGIESDAEHYAAGVRRVERRVAAAAGLTGTLAGVS